MDEKTETSRNPAGAPSAPSAGLDAARQEFDRFFSGLGLPDLSWRSGFGWPAGAKGLRVDVAETGDGIEVTAELPGVEEKDVDVSLNGDMLRIRAEKRGHEDRSDKTWHVVERAFGSFERSLRVPPGIDPDAVKATFSGGVLTVTLPKPPEADSGARKIAISAG